MDVTGTNLLARCLVPIDSPYAAGIRSEEASNGIYTNSSAGWIWVGNTSHDQYCGVQCGPADAYDMVPDPVIRSSISDLVTRLVDFLSGHLWSVVMPDGRISTSFLSEYAHIPMGNGRHPVVFVPHRKPRIHFGRHRKARADHAAGPGNAFPE